MDDGVAVVLREVAVDAAHVELLHLEVLRELVAVLLLRDEDEHGALGHEGDEARHEPLPLEAARPHHLHDLGGERESLWLLNRQGASGQWPFRPAAARTMETCASHCNSCGIHIF